MDRNNKKEICRKKDKIFYREGKTLVKLFDESYPKENVLNEALNQARVENTPLHVPHILGVSTLEGKWAIVMDFIEGETLSSLMEKRPERREEYISLLVRLQTDISACRVPLLPRLKDKMDAKIARSEYPETVKYDLQTRLQGLPKHYKLCHGDFCPGNVIVTSEGVPYIIDWAHATQGNASADAARTYLTFRLRGEDENAESYMKLYCERTGTARGYIEEILPIVAATQTEKSTEEEKKMLRSWVNVVDWQ